jgi:hypothetical protein
MYSHGKHRRTRVAGLLSVPSQGQKRALPSRRRLAHDRWDYVGEESNVVTI